MLNKSTALELLQIMPCQQKFLFRHCWRRIPVYEQFWTNSKLSRYAFSALMLLDGWWEGYPACKKLSGWGADVVICLGWGADLHMMKLMPLPLTISCTSKSRLVLPFWYWHACVVLDKGPLNGCCCCSKFPRTNVLNTILLATVPSVLWHCWLGGRNGIWPVKNWVVGCWRSYLSGASCRFAYSPAMPLPLTISCSSKSRLVLPSWCRLSRVVPDKVQEGRKMAMCVLATNNYHQFDEVVQNEDTEAVLQHPASKYRTSKITTHPT